MKKIILIINLLSAGLLLFAENVTIVQTQPIENSQSNISRENVIFLEDFEDGIDSWTTSDITDPGSFWNTTTFNAFGGTGKSWRMADENISPDGGYEDSWYQVLDTPEITLPSSGNLTILFDQYRAIEELGSNGNFNGWDGFNVRIRNTEQDYSEAEILTDCIPAYNSTSLYSFGFEHNEDPDGIPGIPGWGGSTDWISTSISIPASYIGSEVIISFVFASDPNTSTGSNPELTGLFIDNIDIAGVFVNDGEDETGFMSFSNTVKGGDLWHVMEDPSAPSPLYALGCFDTETSFYNANMHNYISSGDLIMPTEGEIHFDMKIKTELDEYSFPECDYFSVEVRYIAAVYYYPPEPPIVIWSNWNSISNPLGDPEIENVVFTGSVSNWSYFSDNWSGYNDLSSLADETIQLRIGLHSNDDIPDGFGLMIDDITLSDSTYTHSNNEVIPASMPAMYNYPNPFNPTTTISYNLTEDSNIELSIYNLKGQKVKQLVNDQLSAGQHSVVWNGTDQNNQPVSSGIYLYKLNSGSHYTSTKKMILLK
ncbi:MAG: T9SS type A sorting domain-containing protein [Candidatus Cloacimonetes bacterium]|nr:T9SS type A sorting domain-containing protein [Candidatus Cloacimonadota bacterium]